MTEGPCAESEALIRAAEWHGRGARKLEIQLLCRDIGLNRSHVVLQTRADDRVAMAHIQMDVRSAAMTADLVKWGCDHLMTGAMTTELVMVECGHKTTAVMTEDQVAVHCTRKTIAVTIEDLVWEGQGHHLRLPCTAKDLLECRGPSPHHPCTAKDRVVTALLAGHGVQPLTSIGVEPCQGILMINVLTAGLTAQRSTAMAR